jgi:peptidyl-prolyl cis-trans isomerase SurA
MPPIRRLLAFAACAFVALAALPATAQTQVVEEIVARINDQIITRSEFERSKVQLKQELDQQFGAQGAARYAEREKDILRDLIDQRLLVQRAKDNGIAVENDVIKRLDEMRKSMNLESMEDLEREAQKQGISFEDFKDNLRNNMLTQRVIGQEVGRKINILPSEAAKYYQEHRAELKRPESVELAEILVSTEAKPGDNASEMERVNRAEAKAKELLAKIRGGAKFEDVAKTGSDGPTAAEGGSLGQFTRGQLAKELETTVFDTLKQGEVSDVIRTRQGFILLKVLKHTPEGTPELKDVEDQVHEAIYYEKLQPALREFLTKLREDAYIDLKPGYVDTGASPNQTKPILTAEASKEGEKTKKRKKKLGIF